MNLGRAQACMQVSGKLGLIFACSNEYGSDSKACMRGGNEFGQSTGLHARQQ